MRYDLTRLGLHRFESLVYELGKEFFGSDLQPFEMSPDKRSESVFEELDRHPISSAQPAWSGYGVMQVRFNDEFDNHQGTDWLASQITAELDFWLNSRSVRFQSKKPKYVIFVTNMEVLQGDLTSKRLHEIFRKRSSALRLADWAIWDAQYLAKLLDVSPAVRRKYAGFLVPGDVLGTVDQYISGGLMEDLRRAIPEHAAKELIREQWIRLGQSGSPNNEKRTLGEIAIDLAATERGTEHSPIGGIVRQIIGDGDFLLRPSHLKAVELRRLTKKQSREEAEWRKKRRDELRKQYPGITNERLRPMLANDWEREIKSQSMEASKFQPGTTNYVIIGGPGQGKTTLGQLLCQVYRATLLARRDSVSLGPAAEIIEQLQQRILSDLELPTPSLYRWPIRIALSKMAEVLNSGGPNYSILRFIAAEVSQRTAIILTAAHMQTWLGAWPWLLVLDGLDEIALPAMRARVQAKLLELLVDAASVDADLLIVGTTRPQGYLDEFRPEQFRAVTLDPLDRGAAAAYARRLREVRHADDPDMQLQLEKGVAAALEDRSTSRLMRTPLQITVMSLLLERRSRAPDNRYQLFDTYFETIYAREVAKEGYLGALLDEHPNDISYIHQRVALNLQMRAETSGETKSLLDNDELERLTVERLLAEGMEPDPAAKLAKRLLKAATDRLVLLVPLVQDKIGFEVRSLQEYMAAKALTSGPDDLIMQRLSILAPASFWRNTWLLAAGNVFHQREHLRSRIVSVLSEMDSESTLAHLLMPSAGLALDLLDDDVPGKAPLYQRIISKHALQLMDVPPSYQLERLAVILRRVASSDTSVRQMVQQKIDESLKTADYRKICAVLFLGWWADDEDPWASRKLFVALRDLNANERRQIGVAQQLTIPHNVKRRLHIGSGGRSQDRDFSSELSELLSLTGDVGSNPKAGRALRQLFIGRSRFAEMQVRESDLAKTSAAGLDDPFTVQETILQWMAIVPARHWNLSARIREGVEQWYSQRPMSDLLIPVVYD